MGPENNEFASEGEQIQICELRILGKETVRANC
jgi:hypothetical protein